MQKILITIVTGFVIFCGFLVLESGLFNEKHRASEPCILLQQTSGSEQNETADDDSDETTVLPQLKASKAISFIADNAHQQTIIIGAEDPNTEDPETGFKFQLELSSKGASIRKVTFSNGSDKGFDDRDPKNPMPLVLLSPVKFHNREILSMANKEFVFLDHKLQLRLHELYWQSLGKEIEPDGCQKVTFWTVIKNADTNEPVIKLVKKYKTMPGTYDFFCELTVENLSDTEQNVRLNLTGPAGIGREGVRMDMRKVVAGFRNINGQITSARLDAKKLRKADSPDELRLIKNGDNFLWAAVTNKYFAAVVVPLAEENQDYCSWIRNKTGQYYDPDLDPKLDSGKETIGLELDTAKSTLAPSGQFGSEKTFNFQLYLGPKDKTLFDKNQYYKNLGFVQTIDFLGCCCPAAMIRPIAFGILAFMKWMYGFIGNYGIVIIILVFIVRLILHPVTKSGQVRMNRFSKILSDPEILEIKKKYAKNRLEMQKRISEFQRSKGVSPADALFGMLPMLVQMPIWISLWSAVNTGIDLRGAGFLPFWITDLSMPDALFRFQTITVPLLGWKISSLNLLPILMGVAFYLQQKMMPQQPAATPEAAQQQKIMKVMMLVLFPVILYSAPSGVNLYIMASTFAGVIEQHVIRKHIQEKEQAESQGLVEVTSKTGGKVKKKKPKPFFRQF